jgi:hypothetical protein
MASPGDEFFDQLGRRGYEPSLAKVAGTVRVEVVQGLCTEHWYVRMDDGNVRVSRENIAADAVLRIDRDLFDRVFGGGLCLIPPMLRGESDAEGDASLIIALERLRPGRPTRQPRELVRAG